MFRLSKLTDYAVVVLIRLSHGPVIQTARGIAATTGIPEPTIAKVLKMLSHAGLTSSQRGAQGGYRLARDLPAIAVAEVIQAFDGPIALTSCVGGGECDTAAVCPMHGRWDPVNEAIRSALNGLTLADMETAMPRVMRVPASDATFVTA